MEAQGQSSGILLVVVDYALPTPLTTLYQGREPSSVKMCAFCVAGSFVWNCFGRVPEFDWLYRDVLSL